MPLRIGQGAQFRPCRQALAHRLFQRRIKAHEIEIFSQPHAVDRQPDDRGEDRIEIVVLHMGLAAQALRAHRLQPFGKIGQRCRDRPIGPVKILAGERRAANGGIDIGARVPPDRISVMLRRLRRRRVSKQLDEAADHRLGQRVLGFEMIEQAALAHAGARAPPLPG